MARTFFLSERVALGTLIWYRSDDEVHSRRIDPDPSSSGRTPRTIRKPPDGEGRRPPS
jgi:hypothetical protein